VYKHGNEIPSVTTILACLNKPFLYRWYAKYGWDYCEHVKEVSQRFGTRIHSLVEANLKTGRSTRNESRIAGKIIKNFEEWRNSSGFKAVSIEPQEPLVSKVYGYQGTYDAIGYFKDSKELWMCDWKTSKQVDDTFGLQLSAYAWLYGENQGWTEQQVWATIPNGLALRMDKQTGKVEPHVYEHLQYYFDVFKSLILPYQFLNKLGGWKKPEE
jgi:hypothetical protein